MTVFRPRVKDEKLANHYQHLHNEVALLHLTISNLVRDLSTISFDDKTRLLALDKQMWEDDRVPFFLSQKLGTSNDAFVDTLRTVLKSLDGIFSDRVLKLGRSDIVVCTPTRVSRGAGLTLLARSNNHVPCTRSLRHSGPTVVIRMI